MPNEEQPIESRAPVSDSSQSHGNKERGQSEKLATETGDTPKNTVLEIEAVKVILSSSLDFIKTTGQALQTLSSLLLTAYIALLVGFCKDASFEGHWTYILTFLPIALLLTSLVITGAFAIIGYRGRTLLIDEKGIAYEPFDLLGEIVNARKRQIYIPALLTMLGVVSIIVSFFAVIAPAQRLKSHQTLSSSSAVAH